ncbi:MAG: cobalamin-independent methionine synthase II family protein [Anaerolineales bacterium]|nr:cobalamin-independent methionine synthase II family protein [Anaerolineales bacterium]
MLGATKDVVLPTAIVGSIPRPAWYTASLKGRPFKLALSDRDFREQYLDAVGAYIHDQTSAGLDIIVDGDARFDNDVGGRGWFSYVLERLGGFEGHNDVIETWAETYQPGQILWEVMEAYQQPTLTGRLSPGPLHYAAIWQVAQRMTDKPVKFGAISVDSLASFLKNRAYDSSRDLLFELASIVNQEYQQLASVGCPIIQIEEPHTHFSGEGLDKSLIVDTFNKQVDGIKTEIWAHTCWGNPAQQSATKSRSYEPALEDVFEMNADVITFECASTGGEDLEAIGKIRSDKKVAIGVISHLKTQVETYEEVAALIRRALKFIPVERLVITTDCGFGREGLSRRISYYKMVALVEGTNLVRRELGIPASKVRVSDPKFSFSFQG